MLVYLIICVHFINVEIKAKEMLLLAKPVKTVGHLLHPKRN